jgi:hypothetical protein
MNTTLPNVLQCFSPQYKQELQIKLTGHKKQFKDSDLALLESMIKQLKKANKMLR